MEISNASGKSFLFVVLSSEEVFHEKNDKLGESSPYEQMEQKCDIPLNQSTWLAYEFALSPHRETERNLKVGNESPKGFSSRLNVSIFDSILYPDTPYNLNMVLMNEFEGMVRCSNFKQKFRTKGEGKSKRTGKSPGDDSNFYAFILIPLLVFPGILWVVTRKRRGLEVWPSKIFQGFSSAFFRSFKRFSPLI